MQKFWFFIAFVILGFSFVQPRKRPSKKGPLYKKEFIICPTPACHASTLVHTPKGGTLVAWFGGTVEGSNNTAIWGAIHHRSGIWTKPYLIAKVAELPHWNPVLFWSRTRAPKAKSRKDAIANAALPEKKLWLHFKVGRKPNSWTTFVSHSTDSGRSWVRPTELVRGDAGSRGAVKNKPLVLEGAKILAGSSDERERTWRAFVDISLDGGLTWTSTAFLDSDPIRPGARRHPGLIQPTIWASSPQHVHVMLRSNAKHIYRADSSDGGRTWSKAYRTLLPNNNSGIDVARLGDGTLVLAHNPFATGRWPLRLSVSRNNGRTWVAHWDVETVKGEYSYPAIIPWSTWSKKSAAKRPVLGVDLSYTCNRTRIGLVSIPLIELLRQGNTTVRL